MVLVKILERKDASSLIAAIAAGLAVGSFAINLADRIVSSVLDNGPGLDLVDDFLQPVFAVLLALLILEGLARLVVAVRGEVTKR